MKITAWSYLDRRSEPGVWIEMPSSTVLYFADPDTYHAAIRAQQVEGVITARGDFRAEQQGDPGDDVGDRDRHQFRFLGVGALRGDIPFAIRGIAFNDATPARRRAGAKRNPRAADEIY
jgi:hypothetical protein